MIITVRLFQNSDGVLSHGDVRTPALLSSEGTELRCLMRLLTSLYTLLLGHDWAILTKGLSLLLYHDHSSCFYMVRWSGWARPSLGNK